MFRNTSDFFSGTSPLQLDPSAAPSERDVQLAVLVLLLDLADCDDTRSSEELSTIVRTMDHAFGLRDEQVGDLIEIAQVIDRDRTKREQFITSINAHLNQDQKCHLLSMLWRVAIADGVIDSSETDFTTRARNRLGLTLEAAILARKKAEEAAS